MPGSDDRSCCPECEGALNRCRDCGFYRCVRCDSHLRLENGEATVVADTNASAIAREIGTIDSPAGEVGLAFGKAFEEAYATYWHRRKRGGYDGWGSIKHAYHPKRVFGRRLAGMLRERDVYADDLVARGVRLFSAFLAADVRGLTPATIHRRRGDLIVYAKPDLRERSADPPLTEFKTAPIDEYARVQATVMAWVFQESVRLVGARTDPATGWIDVESERIDPSPAPIDRFRENM